MKYHIPWNEIPEKSRAATETELYRELPADHVLAGQRVRALARRQDQDEVLFALDDGRCAVVHLTFCKTPETDRRWPSTDMFASLEDWVERGMKWDAEDFGPWEEDEDENAD